MGRNKIWTKEKCIEEASKHYNVNDWKLESRSSYNASRRNGWHDELKKCVISYGYWTKERCIEEAKKHKTIKSWCNSSKESLKSARENGWMDECTAHHNKNKPRGYWTKERCIEEAKKYDNIGQWRIGNGSSQAVASQSSWYNECTTHMTKLQLGHQSGYWTKERCIKEAKKYNKKGEWSKNSSGSYSSATKKGWLDECTTHMTKLQINKKPTGYWNNKKRCIKEVKKYNKMTHLPKGIYNAILRNNWNKELSKYLKPLTIEEIKIMKPIEYWTKERCIEEAKKYDTNDEWISNSIESYNIVVKNGWRLECVKHMVDYRNKTLIKLYELVNSLKENSIRGKLTKDIRVKHRKTLMEIIRITKEFKKEIIVFKNDK